MAEMYGPSTSVPIGTLSITATGALKPGLFATVRRNSTTSEILVVLVPLMPIGTFNSLQTVSTHFIPSSEFAGRADQSIDTLRMVYGKGVSECELTLS
jgi:hypothetical protein